MSVAPPGGQNRVMIYGPKDDGTSIVEFGTAAGEALAISIPRSEASVIRHFQERMPYGLGRAGRFVRNIRCVQGVFVDGVLPAPLVRIPETPPDLPLQMPQSGGVLVCERNPPKSSWRSNGGDWTEGLTRNRDWNVRLYAGIALCWLYFCKRKGR